MRHGIAAAATAFAVLCAAAAADAAASHPNRRQMDAVRDFVERRTGVVGVAVADGEGRVRAVHGDRRFVGASVVKAMLLVAYLRRAAREDRALTSSERAQLAPMIRRSSNKAASWVYARVGDTGLRRLARRAQMSGFSICCRWTNSWFDARDQAKFFHRLERLTPRRFRPYAKRLLGTVAPRRSWGAPKVAGRRGLEVLHKSGWRRTPRGKLVHHSARISGRGVRFSVAALTDGNPSFKYGRATITGIVRLLLRHAPTAGVAELGNTRRLRRAGLWNVQSRQPDIRVDVRYATRNNFTGRRLPGYCEPWALLKRRPARALWRVQRDLARRGLGLKVFDGYRPARASRAMVRWAHRTGQGHLVGTYIASRSNHNRGHAVDLTLVRLDSGRELRMGRFDSFGKGAHTRNATGRKLRNRMILVRAMERRGFANYWREWWHFEHRARGTRLLDIPIGC